MTHSVQTTSWLNMLLGFFCISTVIAIIAITAGLENIFLYTALSGMALTGGLAFRNQIRRPSLSRTDLEMITLGPDPILVVDDTGTIVASNPAANSMFDIKQGNLIGRKVESLIPAASRAQHANLRALYFKSGGRFQMRNAVTGMSNTGRTLNIEVHLNHVTIGENNYAVAAIRDISVVIEREKQLAQSESRFRETFEKTSCGLAHLSLGGAFIRANQPLMFKLGYTQDQLTTLTFQDLTHPDDLEQYIHKLKSLTLGKTHQLTMNARVRNTIGNFCWVKLTVSLIRDDIDQPDYFILAFDDVDFVKLTEDRLALEENKFRGLAEAMSEDTVVWVSTPGINEILYVNTGFEKIWGRSRGSLYNNPKSFMDLIHHDDIRQVREHIVRHANGTWDIKYRIIRDDGDIRHIHDTGKGVFGKDKQLAFLVGTAHDCTDEELRQHQLEDSLEQLRIAYQKLAETADCDGLTDVLNRHALYRELEQEFVRYKRYRAPTCLLHINIQEFRQINKKYGHQTGDRALRYFASILREVLRESDSLGRIGADEFAVLVRESNRDSTLELAERLLATSIEVPVTNELTIPIQISCGIAPLTPHITTVDEWLSSCDKNEFRQEKKAQQWKIREQTRDKPAHNTGSD
ncbi:PAS domain S-box protein [Parasalinivibrio latis]|uniref:sensor domain-containing diguanylate cyclase n=1 Tax=Parasalinivibrio latis TaxID=2952610 RepID=UPI0030E18286